MARLDFQDMEKSYTFKVGKVIRDSRRVKKNTTNPAKQENSKE